MPATASSLHLFEILPAAVGHDLSHCAQYLLTVNPCADISEEVREKKTYLRRYIPDNSSLYSRAHLTVASLWLPMWLESRFLEGISMACASAPTKCVELCGYGKFENRRGVLYIKALGADYFAGLQSAIKIGMLKGGIKHAGGVFPNVPHLTLVKDLTLACLDHWWRKIGGRPYHRHFSPTNLVVLKRNLNGSRKCEAIENLPFSGEQWRGKPQVVQAQLF